MPPPSRVTSPPMISTAHLRPNETALTSGDDSVAVMTLSQGYNPGWIAFPSLRPWQQLEHVIYNGWANGWVLDTSLAAQELTILYWPQLLLWIGLLALGIVAGWLGWLSWKELRRDRSDRRRLSHLVSALRKQLYS
jgi:hypothetical protein